jgi:hypothetical protein
MRITDSSADNAAAPSDNSASEPYEDFAAAEVTVNRKQGSKPGMFKPSAAAAAGAGVGKFGGGGGKDAGPKDDGGDDDGASSIGDSASDAGDGQDGLSSAMSAGEDLHADARLASLYYVLSSVTCDVC